MELAYHALTMMDRVTANRLWGGSASQARQRYKTQGEHNHALHLFIALDTSEGSNALR
jgi:hypothetical protein